MRTVADFVRAGDVVVWGQGQAEPTALVRDLIEVAPRVQPLRCFVGVPSSEPLAPDDARLLGLVSYCGAGANRGLRGAGLLDVLPVHYSTLPGLLESGTLRADIVMLEVPAPAADGTVGFGAACEYLPAAARAARHVLVQVNSSLPDIAGPRLPLKDVEVVGLQGRSLPSSVPVSERGIDAVIAERVVDLIPNGATLQFGLGSIPAAVARRLGGHRELGVHSGIVGDDVVDLIKAGVVTNEHKTLDFAVTVGGLFTGSQRSAAFVHSNSQFQLLPTEYTHNRDVLSSMPTFTAVNSALEVDLTGQVNAESVRGRYVGAVGGAVDFFRGAAASAHGMPIVAMGASVAGRSTIVSHLSGPVSTARSDAGVIVTEHGSADLRGLTIEQRRRAMMAIAAPEFRDDLARSAHGD